MITDTKLPVCTLHSDRLMNSNGTPGHTQYLSLRSTQCTSSLQSPCLYHTWKRRSGTCLSPVPPFHQEARAGGMQSFSFNYISFNWTTVTTNFNTTKLFRITSSITALLCVRCLFFMSLDLLSPTLCLFVGLVCTSWIFDTVAFHRHVSLVMHVCC